MKEEEIKYLISLLDDLNENISEEIMQIYYNVEENKPIVDISNETLDFLTQNLISNPVTSSTLTKFIQANATDNKSVVNKIQTIYLNVLEQHLTKTDSIERLLTLISSVRWNDDYISQFINIILKHVCEDSYRQYRKQILISLMPHERPDILRTASEIMQKNDPNKEFKLTPEYILELCYQEKTHWLLKAAQVYKHQLHDLKNVTFKINNFTKQILIMILIDLTNSPESYDLPSLVNQLTNIFSILDTFTTADNQLQFYITEVKRELTIIKFCLENNCKIMTTSIFCQVLKQSALSVIAQVCRLSKIDRYKVSRLLNVNNDIITELHTLINNEGTRVNELQNLNWNIATYNSYCAIAKIIDTIMNLTERQEDSQDIATALTETKRLILSIQPVQCCLEVIENIFSCLFLRYEYFSCHEHYQDYPCGAHSDCSYFYSKKQSHKTRSSIASAGFMCNSLTTQMILKTLKICLETIEDNLSLEENDQSVIMRLQHLVKVVNHSIWKLQLVSTLSPDTRLFQLRLCFDYVDVDESSEEEDHEIDIKIFRKKHKMRKKHNKAEIDQRMFMSTISATDDAYYITKENTIDFISIMLAKPNSLVALALYHNDFTKANQIIEMFDLVDAEIATEVAFTEQLRHLVAKIKNIIYYRGDTRYPTKELSELSVISTEVMSLVEGFLATNRAPNSVDIIDLSARHPHLQLYSHQNAPFVNAVDILLSSGLNREITYGLINIVERKLAEVRTCTDVAAVKKTNYIRFVEDIANVTFEIFGNTEKSFNFVDNICGLITDCRIPIKHKEFCKLNQLAKDLSQACEDLNDVINVNEPIKLNSNLLQKYHQVYMNIVAASDKDICNIGEVSRNGSKKTRVHYLRMCYMYCKTVSQLELEENRVKESNVDSSYFSVLEKELHDIFGNMIDNRDIPVSHLEPICKKLNMNLIPKLILTFCPSISLSCDKEASEINFNNLLQSVYEFKNTEESLFIEPIGDFAPLPRSPDEQCLTYIVLHNWVLAHIIKKIHTSPKENCLQQSIDARTKCLNNYMELDRFECTKVLFNGNKYMASLHSSIDLDKLFLYMPQLMETGKILKLLNIIDALSERQLKNSANLINLRDLILFKLAINSTIDNNWMYCEYVKCSELKEDLILNNLCHWPAEGAIEALDYLRFLLDTSDLEVGLHQKCSNWIIKIPLYDQIATIMGVHHWYNIYEKSVENPEQVIDILMDNQQYKLCLEWADVHDVSDNVKVLIITSLLKQLFEYTNQATPDLVRELLNRLPPSQAMDLIQVEMSKVRNVGILQVCVNFITEKSPEARPFENIKIGLQIMLDIEINLRNIFWDLIEKPLLMLEQFLMNAKLDILTSVINKIAPNLKRDPNGDNLYYNIKSIEKLVISRNAVDALLRFYAEKALDMRNPRTMAVVPPRPSNDCLLQSIDSINIEAASKPFLMPEQVPTKEQWMEDYSTDRCMLCRTSIFSMIIRRHHCRRCGRLICHACSRNRMQVPTYPTGVKFRVCNDCYTQTMHRKLNSDQDNLMLSSHSDTGGSAVTCMDWCLSTNGSKNEAVRAEFSYEFTPNVTLCLSIMKMHSINLDYPRFLLDRSDEVARELSRGGDARLLVRARRSLLLAAAELYSRTPQNNQSGARVSETGAAHAARCLAHADALATLVKHQAHHLVPHHGAHPSQIVRSLLEAEKWELALEIATKSGIPRTSVLAAWGKSCLRAGCFKLAREKFSHCFKNTANAYVEMPEDCEYGREVSESPFVNRRLQNLRYSERTSSVSSTASEGRSRTNPPLLNEIVTILEDINYPVNQHLLAKADNIKTTNEKLTAMSANKKKIPVTEPAINIMHILSSVKKIKLGDYSDFHTATVQPRKSFSHNLLRRNVNHNEPKVIQYKKLDPFFYKECVFYLSCYGSHTANIAFYMKHSNMNEVIQYCYDNIVDKETFTEAVYMECLKNDKVNGLLKAMTESDSTLEMWSEYIMHICRTLEMSKRLEALYKLQCGSNQHARASATCALLYSRPATLGSPGTFASLHARHHHLAAALHHLAQCVPAPNKVNNPKSLQFHLDKATIDNLMTTLTRQIELAKYLAACEASGRLSQKVLDEVIPMQQERRETDKKDFRPLTLFGSNTDKIKLVAVVLATGQTIEEGFNLAFKIITEHKLDSMSIYSHVSKYLVHADRFMEVKTLAKCIRESKETAASLMSDHVLESGVSAVVSRCEARGQLHDEQAEILIADIHSVTIKISCYLVCRNVSNAYILAARHERTNDLRRVLHDAERIGNEQVRNACLKRLTSRNVL